MPNKKILGIITARGGSKRVPRKNIKEFLGKPLLVWSIETGLKSNVFDRFILTTDDKEIAEIGKRYGVEVPFIRPKELATDTATSYDTIKHALEWLQDNESYQTDWVILLEPSAPGRQPFHIQEVVQIIQKEGENFDSLVGISKIPAHFSYLKQLQRDKDGIVTRVNDKEILCNLIHRDQDIPPSYYINSVIYAFRTSNFFDKKVNNLYKDRTYGYVIDEKYAIDINTPEDWLIAEVKMKQLLKNN